ncbi:MAG: hypothetical protein ACJAWW_002792 [Sulfurimonas sp.]|jgi:hypothetical protein
MEGKYYYEWLKENDPNVLGSAIIGYVEGIIKENKELKKSFNKAL